MTPTPIPANLEHRPTIGGLVCPWINVELADGGVDFRAHHDTRSQQSFVNGICQVCAEPITAPFVFLGGPNQLRTLSFDEPPLHPVCAHYTSNACPMVTGKLEHYATHNPLAAGHRGHRCPDVGCDCGGWIPRPARSRSCNPGSLGRRHRGPRPARRPQGRPARPRHRLNHPLAPHQ